MSTSSLPAPVPKLKKKGLLHFNLPSFRRSTAERPEEDSDEIARVRKAAAWQWYTRGIPDVVAPTKRAPAAAASNSSTADNNSNKNMQRRSMSRFNAEAASAAKHPSAQGTAPSPLYDEFELSGLKSHMSELVHRLQQKQQEEGASAAKSGIITASAKDKIKQLISYKQPSSRATQFQSPLSAIHKFFRKISGAMQKSSAGHSSTNSPQISANNHGPAPDAADDDEMQYHYHHYIHHHHHHYHYAGCSPEENLDMPRRRRHSESSEYRHTLLGDLCEAVAADEEEKEDPIKASPRRRRHSESFYTHAMRRSVDPIEGIGGPRASPALSITRNNSERFSTHKRMPGAKGEQHIDDADADGFEATPRMRRHSAESFRSYYKLDCATPAYHEAAALYKLSTPSPTVRRRHSERFDPASNYNKATEYESPNKAGTGSPTTLRQTPMRRQFESLSERHFVESLSQRAQFSTGNLAGRAM